MIRVSKLVIFKNISIYQYLWGIIILLFSIDFLIYGTSISGDTQIYLRLAALWGEGTVPRSAEYLPGYSLIIYLFSQLLNIKLYQSITILQGIFFFLNIYFLFKLSKKIFDDNSKSSLRYSALVILSSFWCFRIQKAAHADSLYFTLFIIYTYISISLIKNTTKKYFVYLSLVLLLLTQIKYNAYILLPFTLIWLFYINGINSKSIAVNLLVILPSFPLIFIWKIYNGRYNERFQTSIFDLINGNYDYNRFVKIIFENISYFGRTILEIFLNPNIARSIPFYVNLIFGIFLIIFLLILLIKVKDLIIKFIICYILFYSISHILINSYSFYNETNLRTLISAIFFSALLLVCFFKFQLSNIFFFNKVMTLFFFFNTVLLSYKWYTSTSPENNFKKVLHEIDYYKDDYELPLNLNKDQVIISNKPNQILLKSNYALNVKEFLGDRVWKNGHWIQLRNHDLDSMVVLMSNNIKNGDVVFFNFPKNDKIYYFIESLNRVIPYKKQGVNSYLFIQ